MATEKLLIATANNSQKFLAQLDNEVHEIRDVALWDAHIQNRIDVIDQTRISYGPLWDVLNTVTGQTTTMLHYIGHSSAQGLLLEGPVLQPKQLSPGAMMGLISQPNRLRLVFLNSCCSQEIARALRAAGVPYVIGTTASVQDNQAVEVAKKFYSLLGNYAITIEEAFRQTQLHFDNDPDNPNPIAPHRGSIDTKVEGAVFPWQIYPNDDELPNNLTDAQRNWRLIPLPEAYIVKPTEFNERYVIKPISKAGKPFTFFLSYLTDDQPLSQTLIQQIREVFRNFGNVSFVWSDEALTGSIDRMNQLTDHLQQADFIFLLVNDAYLANAVARRVMNQAQERYTSNSIAVSPTAFITAYCDWRAEDSPARLFNPCPLSDKPLNAADLTDFAELLRDRMKGSLLGRP